MLTPYRRIVLAEKGFFFYIRLQEEIVQCTMRLHTGTGTNVKCRPVIWQKDRYFTHYRSRTHLVYPDSDGASHNGRMRACTFHTSYSC